ncbi:MAG: hypothetical protein ACXWUK_07840, partial [Burkholderiales bacterium]
MRLLTFAARATPGEARVGAMLDGRVLDLRSLEVLAARRGEQAVIPGSMKGLLKLEGGRRRVADLLDFARRARRRSLGRPAVGSRHHLPAACDGEPGDLFSTGAPGGVAVGQANAAELYLKPGDTIE